MRTVDILGRKRKHPSSNLILGTSKMSLYEIVDKVSEHLMTNSGELLMKVSMGKVPEAELERAIEREIRRNGFKMPDMIGSELAREIKKHLIGYGPIEEYIQNENCSNIFINEPNDVWVQIGRERIKTDIQFGTVENLMSYIRTIQGVLGGALNFDEALVKFVDEKNKLRIICGIQPIAHISPTLIIRKHRQKAFALEELCEIGMMNEEVMKDLERIAHRGDISIMFTGKGGAGKTTIMRAMAEKIDEPNGFKKRLLVMEEHSELHLSRPQTNQFIVKRDKGRLYGIEHFTDFGNLMSIDLYIFGEIRGAEALPFFDGAFAGNTTWNTSHSESSLRAIPKMAINMKKSGTDIGVEILEHQLYESVNLIIHLDSFCVTEITEVLGNKELNPIYKYNVKKRMPTFIEGEMMKVGEFKNEKLMDLNIPRVKSLDRQEEAV